MTTTTTTTMNSEIGGEPLSTEAIKGLTLDVLNAFEEMFQKKLNPKQEWPTVKKWAEEHGFRIFEFRLFIEHEWKDERSRNFLLRPGMCNLRQMFNPARAPLILEVVEDLKQFKEIEKKASADEGSSPNIKFQKVRSNCCGETVKIKHIKTPGGKANFFWKQDTSAYAAHSCFAK